MATGSAEKKSASRAGASCGCANCAARSGGTWRQKMFASLLAKGSKTYEASVSAHKRQLFGGLDGTVLEIGPGPGTNLRYLQPGTRWIGVEPNPYMSGYVETEALRLGVSAELLPGTGESLPLADRSVDHVISSLVLCSVEDVHRVLREVQRVLRPHGTFRFIEHVASPDDARTARWQGWLNGFARFAGDGCNINRQTWKHIENAGFSNLDIEHLNVSGTLKIYSPHIVGTAFN